MKRAFTLIEFIVVVAIILVLAAILFPVLVRKEHPTRSSCQLNLKQIGLGFLQYTQDYNDKFPPARVTTSTGWADAVYPYIKSRQVFQCGATQSATEPLTDYYYNRRAAGEVTGKFEAVGQTILAGEGNDDAPTWASLNKLPPAWAKDEKSPAWRHLDGANYGFADGHVKWLKPNRVNSALSDKGYPAFAITFGKKP